MEQRQRLAPKLLLALKQCDTAEDADRKKGYSEVQVELMAFHRAWENLKQVYSGTRFIKYPDNYVPDRYFHFASQREDLTWMTEP